jgi:hypothetical protein
MVSSSKIKKTTNAPQVKYRGANTNVAINMALFHNERHGSQVTTPDIGSACGSIRNEFTLYGPLAESFNALACAVLRLADAVFVADMTVLLSDILGLHQVVQPYKAAKSAGG